MKKRALYIVLSALIVFACISNITAYASGPPADPPGTVYGTGYMPSGIVYPEQPPRSMLSSPGAAQYPSGVSHANNAATLAAIRAVQSPVQNQGVSGLCWSFASMGAIEAATIIRASAGTNPLSPVHAGYALSTSGGNLDYGFAGRNNPGDGGNADMIMHYAMRDELNGFVRFGDDDADFLTQAPLLPRTVAATSDIPRSFVVPGAYRINTARATNAQIKQAVVNYGAVTTAMFGDLNINAAAAFWNSTTNAYYQPAAQTQAPDHLVLIVGWDDTYPSTNFNLAYRPASNGAWLVKNSWGTTWGMEGYFWISYEDKYAGTDSWVFDAARPITGDSKIYDINRGHVAGYYQTAYGTNVFTAGSAAEMLTQVRVYVHAAPSTIRVFLTNNYTGTGQVAATISANNPIVSNYYAEFVGFHTIDIPTQPTIPGGTRFAVTVDYGAGNTVPYTTIRAGSSGSSFVGAAGATTDISTSTLNRAVPIKAVINFASGSAPAQITSHPANRSVQEGNTAVFSVSAAGSPAPTFQWQVFPNSGSGWTDISGANSNMLSIANVTIDGHNGNRYRVIVSNNTGQENTVTSNAATLSVTESFGPVPHTGIPDVSADMAAASVFVVVSTALWLGVLVRKRKRNG